MKILVISDIHGSAFYADKIKEISDREGADIIFILGDLYYHGPRNPLPIEYDPMRVAEILNSMKDKLVVIKGNCDAEVDESISEFSFEPSITLEMNNKVIFFTHGHKLNSEKDMPNEKIDILIYGHLHKGFIVKEDDVIIANPGSISLPKEGSKNSYIVLTENNIVLKDIYGNYINRMSFVEEENEEEENDLD